MNLETLQEIIATAKTDPQEAQAILSRYRQQHPEDESAKTYDAIIDFHPSKPTASEVLELARKSGQGAVKDRLSGYADIHPEDTQYVNDLRELVAEMGGTAREQPQQASVIEEDDEEPET